MAKLPLDPVLITGRRRELLEESHGRPLRVGENVFCANRTGKETG
jgi:hypothetical protein